MPRSAPSRALGSPAASPCEALARFRSDEPNAGAVRRAEDQGLRRQEATLLSARADRAETAERAKLRRQAADVAALADQLDRWVKDLTKADEARARWYVHTAETRAAADRARAELIDRGIDLDRPADAIPVAHWLAAHEANSRADDARRRVTAETDFADENQQRAQVLQIVEPVPVSAAETAVPDLRDLAAANTPAPARGEEGRGRIATVEETAAAVERAQRALLELRARKAAERERAEEEHVFAEDQLRCRRHGTALYRAGRLGMTSDPTGRRRRRRRGSGSSG